MPFPGVVSCCTWFRQALLAFGTLIHKLHVFSPVVAAQELDMFAECFDLFQSTDMRTHARRLEAASQAALRKWETLSPSVQETWLRMQPPLQGMTAHMTWEGATEEQRWEWTENARAQFVAHAVHDVAVRSLLSLRVGLTQCAHRVAWCVHFVLGLCDAWVQASPLYRNHIATVVAFLAAIGNTRHANMVPRVVPWVRHSHVTIRIAAIDALHGFGRQVASDFHSTWSHHMKNTQHNGAGTFDSQPRHAVITKEEYQRLQIDAQVALLDTIEAHPGEQGRSTRARAVEGFKHWHSADLHEDTRRRLRELLVGELQVRSNCCGCCTCCMLRSILRLTFSHLGLFVCWLLDRRCTQGTVVKIARDVSA